MKTLSKFLVISALFFTMCQELRAEPPSDAILLERDHENVPVRVVFSGMRSSVAGPIDELELSFGDPATTCELAAEIISRPNFDGIKYRVITRIASNVVGFIELRSAKAADNEDDDDVWKVTNLVINIFVPDVRQNFHFQQDCLTPLLGKLSKFGITDISLVLHSAGGMARLPVATASVHGTSD